SHLAGCGVSVMDMTGLAQKGGAATSHVRIARRPEDIHASRVGSGSADLILGCDVLATGSNDLLARMAAGRTRALVNTAQVPTAAFVKDPDWQFPGANAEHDILQAIGGAGEAAHAVFVDARSIVVPLMGDAIYTNPFMLGLAWQKGWIPLPLNALDKAIELNGVSVATNRAAFHWGRCAAHDLAAVLKAAAPAPKVSAAATRADNATSLDATLDTLEADLTVYQNAAYAARWRELVGRVRKAEARLSGRTMLTEAVARNYYKLLAYKDEYEVARLYTATSFIESLKAQFEDGWSLRFHFAPPALSWLPWLGKQTSAPPAKRQFGPWMLPALRVLARLKFLRGTA
ncbi:MAG: indolepyruvate ferredoxin oxidoreductase family protein, partial [Lysobacteraceae bacterium]